MFLVKLRYCTGTWIMPDLHLPQNASIGICCSNPDFNSCAWSAWSFLSSYAIGFYFCSCGTIMDQSKGRLTEEVTLLCFSSAYSFTKTGRWRLIPLCTKTVFT